MTQGDAKQALADAQACLDRGALAAGLAAADRAAVLATDNTTRAQAGWLQAQLTYRRGDYAGVLALADTLTPMLRAEGGDNLREFLRSVVFAGAEIGRFDLALPAAYEVHALAEATGRAGPRSQALNAFGICFERMGDPWQAERLLRDALSLARDGEVQRELLAALNNLCAVLIGAYYLQRGAEASPESLAALNRALPLAEEMVALLGAGGDPYMRAISEGNLGEILVHLGERERSQQLLQRTQEETTRLGFMPQRRRVICSLAEWELRHGTEARARDQLQALLAEVDAEGAALPPMTAVRAHHALYQAHKALGETAAALQHLETQAELLRERVVQQLRVQSEQFITRVEAEQSRREADRQRARAQSLEADARRDPLTGLGNRRAVDHQLSTLLSDAAAAGQPVTLAMLDLDRFKQINDRHGHLVGDRVLVTAAQLLRECVRHGDLVARIGGEEFLAVLPDADAARAREICERIRQRFVGHDWGALAPGLTVTLSAGLASTPPYDETALTTRADRALYRAKANGRDRVEAG
ncbi:MAG: GGDEF domain-containing protein [Burkholderiaceae bacterium]|nr:GGDEF domain-containing protein [Burkholderiaceae bacterium]